MLIFKLQVMMVLKIISSDIGIYWRGYKVRSTTSKPRSSINNGHIVNYMMETYSIHNFCQNFIPKKRFCYDMTDFILIGDFCRVNPPVLFVLLRSALSLVVRDLSPLCVNVLVLYIVCQSDLRRVPSVTLCFLVGTLGRLFCFNSCRR